MTKPNLPIDEFRWQQSIEDRLQRMERRLVQEVWIAPTLLNGWVRYDGTYNEPGYMLDANGFVHLRGMLRSGTINASMFVLPVGYRPNLRELHVTISNNAIARCDITPAGDVIPNVGSNTWFSIDGITFRAFQ